ncbi:hypothetical protein BGY98DRAFT_1101407 [Russula aff. rugulosa BPL654]|nr:hypothetical protein BGY98DRAFT_1101407 [Russula aff. rugulosa BPL654]
MDQHQHRSRSSSRSEREPTNPICLPVCDPHKTHSSPSTSTCFACAPTSPSTSAPSHRHLLPAKPSTPQTNEANALFPPHYITSSFSTPRRTSSVLPSPFLVPSPALPTLLTMSSQVLAPPLPSLNPPLHDQPRPSSRSERLLRETLRRDRAASLSPRSRMPRPDFASGRVASTTTSSEMFHCACNDSDDEVDRPNGSSHHVSLLFANLPQHQQKHSPPLQRASKSSVDVHSMSRRRESDLKEKEPIPPLFHINPPHRSAVTPAPFEGCLYGAVSAQTRDRYPDRESAWSSTESSSLPSPIPSNHQPLTPSPSPSPPFHNALPETLSHIAITRGRTRNNTYPAAVPLPGQSHQPSQSHSQSHWQRQQVTPPPTPPTFDARGAAAKLRTIDGYVSFANVEGLGGPPGVEEELTEEDRRRGTWWPWRGRSRSGSLGTT